MLWNKFMHVQSGDPENTRQRNLLNLLLLGILCSSIIGLLIIGYGLISKLWMFADAIFLLVVLLGFIAGSLIIYAINRRWGKIALYLFVFLLILAYSFSDSALQISEGRSVFFYAIPIIIASLLIHPLASFLIAIIGCGIITLAANTIGKSPNSIVMIGFFMLALISWLVSRSLDDALRNLRKLNANLDQLVQERTRELVNALRRERMEAGRSKAILESIADGVIVFDNNGSAIIANSSSMRLLDMPQGELVGATIDKLSEWQGLKPEYRQTLQKLLTNLATQTTSAHIEWGKRTLSVMSAPVNDTQGSLIGSVAVFRDYSQEAELDRMKNTFLAIVSHELRTPLNAILGYSEMIKEAIYGPVNEKQARASDRIMTNSKRLLDIVSDLLDQAQMEAGKLALHIRPFRPADLIENVHSVMDKIASDKGLELTSELDPDLPDLMDGDIARLQQVLVNLINNSVKFTEKGSIHMSLLHSGKRAWVMCVQDTGIGIPEDELPTIFEAFRQLDSTETRKYGGFGLGLAIVKQLTELMGGRISVKSTPGTGSNFSIKMPIKLVKRSTK